MNEQVIRDLVATGKWSEENAKISQRADHRCEYCGLDFFGSAENFKQWQCDHIVPISTDGTEDIENKAASCRTCNWDFKRGWDPRPDAGHNATRAQLIEVVRRRILAENQKTTAEVQRYRAIIGRS